MNLTEPKSLLIGASGQIGSQIMRILGPDRCLATSRNPKSENALLLDLTRISTKDDAELILDDHALDAIYCVAGMTNVEDCEQSVEQAYFTNCRGPERLAEVASERNIPFVYFSTEYVFDGTDGPYVEGDETNPISIYGKSKLAGERAVVDACSQALIVRTTVVYGQDYGHKNYVYSVMRSLAVGKEMNVPADQVSTPTYNRDLALATVELTRSGATGIVHVCGPERMGRLEFAKAIATSLELDSTLLVGLPTSAMGQKARRPLSAGLSIERFSSLLPHLKMRSLIDGITDCRDDLKSFLSS